MNTTFFFPNTNAPHTVLHTRAFFKPSDTHALRADRLRGKVRQSWGGPKAEGGPMAIKKNKKNKVFYFF